MLDASKTLWRYVTPIIVFPGIICNVICIITLQTKAFRGSATAFLLTALAVVDSVSLLVGALHVWMTHVARLEIRTMSDPVCRIHSFFNYLTVQLSAWTLVLVTLERVISVIRPTEAHSLCSRHRLSLTWTVIMCILVGINTFLYLANMELQVQSIEVDNTTYYTRDCVVRQNTTSTMQTLLGPVRVWMDLILSCLLPATFIFFGNALVIYKLAEMARRKKLTQSRETRKYVSRHHSKRTSSKITVMLITVCLVFLLTSLPINIFMLGEDFWFAGRHVDLMVLARRELTYTVLSLLYYINNAVNFVLYFVSGPMFRKAAMEHFCSYKS